MALCPNNKLRMARLKLANKCLKHNGFQMCVSEIFSVYYFWMEGNSDQSQHTVSPSVLSKRMERI